MSLQVEKLEKNMAKLTIEVSAEELEKAIQAAYLKQRKNISVPGFRKGKVPRQMIEKMYGPEIFYDDAANALLPEAYSKAYDESGLEIVSQPSIDVVQLEKGKPFIFTAEVATKPEVTLGEYKGLKVDKISTRVTAKEVDAKLEEEMSGMNRNERKEFLESYGVKDDALGELIKAAYETLGLQSFLTAGKKECRAWTIKKGATAPEAAGTIHTDFQRGFIAASICNFNDLKELGSEQAVKAAGKLRTEGKTYIMQDGDVVEFKFNV